MLTGHLLSLAIGNWKDNERREEEEEEEGTGKKRGEEKRREGKRREVQELEDRIGRGVGVG